MPTWVNVSVAIGTFLVALLAFVVSCLARESAKVAADAARRSQIEGGRRHEECGPKLVKVVGEGVEKLAPDSGTLLLFIVLQNNGDRSYRYGGFAVHADGTKQAVTTGEILECGTVKIFLGEQKLAFDKIEHCHRETGANLSARLPSRSVGWRMPSRLPRLMHSASSLTRSGTGVRPARRALIA
ncbi:MAG TPA: hypothetical protein VGB74_01835 [Actinoplanes sp.]|jgi:hypothetical protein